MPVADKEKRYNPLKKKITKLELKSDNNVVKNAKKADEMSYDKLSDKELANEARRLVEEHDALRNHTTDLSLMRKIELKLASLRDEAYSRIENEDSSMISGLYPEISDPKFNEKISLKREFAKSKYAPIIDSSITYDKTVSELCEARKTFQLTPNQIFLKQYISPKTPYNSILLCHGVGVGKTCTAISIAENFRQVYNKKTLVILPSTLKDNFKKQIFDINKIQGKDFSGYNQCAASKYLNQISDKETLGPEILERKINRLISDNYQFMGFIEFANLVLKIEADIARTEMRPNIAEIKFIHQIKEIFSNRVIIVDEVHNTRADGDETQKLVPPLLHKVLQYAENTKLVLCTATPMFNEAKEIVWLVNLLLANEKRPAIDPKNIFDKSGALTVKGKEILINATRGLVSFMRGENPFSFPQRLYPSINNDDKILSKKEIPTLDAYGKPIPKKNQLHQLEIVKSVMGRHQTKVYSQYAIGVGDVDGNDVIDGEEDIIVDSISKHVSKPVQLSNITFPNDHGVNYGKEGFLNCFDKDEKSKVLKVSYKLKYRNFLDLDQVGDYSGKIKTVVDYILNSKGIVFIYSYYIYSALIPLAIALEHVGFTRHGGDNVLVKAAGNKIRPPFMVNGKQAMYSILSGDAYICPDISKEIDAITSAKNVNGEVVKVVLGTSVSAEGIDFKRIREVHLFEPWYHLNKVEQVIGRAVRTCSHTVLPKEQRNVTIYHHAAVPATGSKEIESIDLRNYRLAENKQSVIKEVEQVLRENAVDCVLNESISYFDPKKLNVVIDLETSQGNIVKGFHLGDNQASGRAPVNCSSKVARNQLGQDTSTFSIDFYVDNIGLYTEHIRSLFTSFAVSYTFKDIEKEVQKHVSNYDVDVLKYALDELINSKSVIYNAMGLAGQLQYTGNKYSFMPLDMPFSYMTATAREDYKSIHTTRILLDANKIVFESKKAINTGDGAKTKINVKTPNAAINADLIYIVGQRLENLIAYLLDHPVLKKVYIACLDSVIDRLSENELLVLAQQIVQISFTFDKEASKIQKLHTENVKNTPYAKEILNSLLASGMLLVSKDTLYFWNPYNISSLMYFDYDNKSQKFTLKEADPYILNEYKKYKTKHASFNILESIIEGNIHVKGFADIGKKDLEIQFKIMGDKKKSQGCVCEKTSTIRVEDLKEYINTWDSSVLQPPFEFKKDQLCRIYELILRSAMSDNGLPMFLRPLGIALYKQKQLKLEAERLNALKESKKRIRKPRA